MKICRWYQVVCMPFKLPMFVADAFVVYMLIVLKIAQMAGMRGKRSTFNLQFWWVKKAALHGSTSCSDLVGILDWGGVLLINLRIWHLWSSMIFGLKLLIKVTSICHQLNLSVSRLCINSRSCLRKSCYKYYNLR